MWAIPGDSCEAGKVENNAAGRGRHIGTSVCASTGTSQYVLFGYGYLIMLDGTRMSLELIRTSHCPLIVGTPPLEPMFLDAHTIPSYRG